MSKFPRTHSTRQAGLRTPTGHPLRAMALLSPLVLMSLAGCNYSSSTLVERSITLEVPLAADASLAVQSENGAISVTERAGQTMTINATIHARTQERADATEIAAEQSPDGGILVVAHWPDKRLGNEKCSFDIAVPAVGAVNLRSSNGRISITGLEGSAIARTSNGAIVIENFVGPVSANTSNGAIKVTNATASIDADSSNGAITVSLTDANPGPVNIKTSNGSIDLTVGAAFAGTLGASTSNGSVSISGPGVQFSQQSRNAATATFGAEAATGAKPSTLRTSNGRITVKRAD